MAPESVGRPKVADGGDDEGPEGHKKSGWFVTANADLSVIASRCRPPNHRADQPLQIPNVRLVCRRDAGVSEFVCDDAQQVALNRFWR